MSLRSKLILSLLLLVLIPLIVVDGINYYQSKKALETVIMGSLNSIAEAEEVSTLLYIKELKTRAKNLSSDGLIVQELINIEKGKKNASLILSDYLVRNKMPLDKNIIWIDVINNQGVIVASTEKSRIGTIVSEDEGYVEGKKTVYIHDFHQMKDGLFEIGAYAPIVYPINVGKELSVIGIHLNGDNLRTLFSEQMAFELGAKTHEYGWGKTLDIYLVNQNRKMITDSVFIDNASLVLDVDTYPVQKCLEQDEEVKGIWPDYRGESVAGASMCLTIGDFKWVLLVEVNEKEAFASITRLGKMLLVEGIIVSLIALLVAIAIARSIAKPIEKLREGVEIISKGDLDYKVGIESRDEVGTLSRSFDNMTDKLQTTMASRDDLDLEIEERKHKEAELKSAEKEMRSLSMFPVVNPNVVAKADRDGNIVYMNTYARKLFEEENLSEPKDILPKGYKDLIVEILNTGKVIKQIEHALGDKKIFEYEIAPYKEEDTVYIFGKDVTELRNKEKALKDANQAKSDFLANMSHELRTPLNAVIGFSGVLKKESFGPLNEKQKEYTTDIQNSGKHLLSLINDILDLSKVEAGKMELEIGDVNLKDAIESSLSMIKEKALKHGIELESDIEDFGIIKADERKIKQIMFNLLSNAAKFTPDGGKINIKAKKANNEILIEVGDSGIGVEEKHMNKVFAEFEQIDSNLSRKQAGTGLGMPLTKKIVELHGGRIWFESEGKNKGTTFYFTLPIRS